MDPTVYAYFDSAQKLKLKPSDCWPIQGIQLQLGEASYYFNDKINPINNGASSFVCIIKDLFRNLLNNENIPTAKSLWVYIYKIDRATLDTKVKDLTFPLRLRQSIRLGKGTTLVSNITDSDLLYRHCELISNEYKEVIIEEDYPHLNAYRFLILNNKIIDVLKLLPANVTGNGVDNIESLINKKNAERLQISEVLKPILLDEETKQCLKSQNLNLDSVLAQGQKINVCYSVNIEKGGEVGAISEQICKENKELILKITTLLNINFCSIEVRCHSLEKSILDTKGIIIEANDTPNIFIHESGISGSAINVSYLVMRSLIFKNPLTYIWQLFSSYKFYLVYLFIIAIAILLPSLLLLLYSPIHGK